MFMPFSKDWSGFPAGRSSEEHLYLGPISKFVLSLPKWVKKNIVPWRQIPAGDFCGIYEKIHISPITFFLPSSS